MNCDKLFGKKIKEGKLNAQDSNEEWVPCNAVVRQYGIILEFSSTLKNIKGENSVNVIMEFSCPQDVKIIMMPDHARRSRESKLFPFAIAKNRVDKNNKKMNVKNQSENKVFTHKDEVVLATTDGRSMWEWASTIQWLGTKPVEEGIPLFYEASTTWNHNEHYENPAVLQTALLKIFTYKKIPKQPVTFDQIAAIARHYPYLSYISYPVDFFEVKENNLTEFQDYENTESDDEERESDGSNTLNNSIDFQECDDSESSDSSNVEEGSSLKSKVLSTRNVENHEYLFGLFAYLVLVGSCVQVNEKCFELITSTHFYDLSTQAKWKGNSPFSMLCEGDYNTSRNYMIQILWKLGYPKLGKFCAGCDRSKAFSVFVSKPSNLWGVGNVTGQPVHLEDQKLCRLLKKYGDGRRENQELSERLINASSENLEIFESRHQRRITDINIPPNVMDWGSTTLKELDLSNNGIFELPDALYDFINLADLNISKNCLFGLSHKLGNLTQLENLNIHTNLITELPDSIEKLEKITEFKCFDNPITKPPSAVWSGGIANVRNFFKDMRESGKERNVDLKVLVLGLSEAGKTSLINGLIRPDRRALTRIGDRTVGIEKRTWVMSRRNKEAANLLMYDFAGQEEYYITHHLFLGSRALYILAFDLSKYEERLLDNQIILWWDAIQNRVSDLKSNGSKTPKVIIVGTHADLLGDHAQDCADNIHKALKLHLDTRIKSLENRIQILQQELSELDPGRKEKGSLNIKENEMLPQMIKVRIKTLEYEIKKLSYQQKCTIPLPSSIYAVSSKNLDNFDKFKEQIASSLTEIGPSGKYFPQLDEELPASWFRLRKFVREESTRKGRECMKLPQYFKLISDELGIDEDVGVRATRFCHELGDVLFFEKEGLIFLRPSLLIDVFKLVIRHDHKESTYWKTNMLELIDEVEFNTAKDLLLRKGELEEWFLDILWLPIYDDLGEESSIKNNLIQLLETFDIATPIEYGGRKRLLIPEFQPKFLDKNWLEHKNEGDFEMQRWICVDRGLPRGLLKRLQVRIMKKIFKRGKNYFDLAQDEFLMKDEKCTMIYCKKGIGSEEFPGSEDIKEVSEGIMIYVQGEKKSRVSSLIIKVHNCVKDALKEFSGLIFDHYAVKASKSGSVCIRLEELKARYDADEEKICLRVVKSNCGNKESQCENIDIEDLLPSPPLFNHYKSESPFNF